MWGDAAATLRSSNVNRIKVRYTKVQLMHLTNIMKKNLKPMNMFYFV